MLSLLLAAALARGGEPAAIAHFFGTHHRDSPYGAYVEAPRTTRRHHQQYTGTGLPQTRRAWAFQSAIDHGILERLAGGLLETLENHHHGAAAGGHMGARDHELEVIRAYVEQANADPRAAFLLDLFPTDTWRGATADLGESVLDGLFRGEPPNDFSVSRIVGQIRIYGLALASALRREGYTVYGLPVPYANTRANIVTRVGRPMDGVRNLAAMLDQLAPHVHTVAWGYSQGARVVLEYGERYGFRGSLDHAVALAPMGGADRRGADGVWAGRMGELPVLTVAHARDPAIAIHGPNLLRMIRPIRNFLDENPNRQVGDCQLHHDFWGWEGREPGPGLSRRDAVRLGVFGYPLPYIAPMIALHLSDTWNAPYARRGDWTVDLREDLVEKDEQGRPMGLALCRDGGAVADQYR